MTASKKELAITREEVLEMLELRLPEYVFYWRVSPSIRSRVRAGSKAGTLRPDGYIRIRINGNLFYAHRLVWFVNYGKFPENFIDHIDGDKSNNKIENLRDVTRKVNQQNCKKPKRVDVDLPTGVFASRNKFDESVGYYATWRDMNGKRCAVYHGVREYYTLEAALAAAVSRRDLEMSNLMSQGADYTERHGS